MAKLPTSLERVIRELSKLPGIGPKTAQRLAFFLLKKDDFDIENLSKSIAHIKEGIVYCSTCHKMANTDPCEICGDKNRDHSLVCVVEESLDALAIDRTKEFKGVFHILGGVLNPLEGIGPEQLNIETLKGRVKKQNVKEIIIATNPSLEGEATSLYLIKMLKANFPEVKVTRIARGLPMGGDLEYADEITLMRALEGRKEI